MEETQKLAPDKQEKVDKFRILNQYAKKGATLFVGSSLMEGFPINEFLMDTIEGLHMYANGYHAVFEELKRYL